MEHSSPSSTTEESPEPRLVKVAAVVVGVEGEREEVAAIGRGSQDEPVEHAAPIRG